VFTTYSTLFSPVGYYIYIIVCRKKILLGFRGSTLERCINLFEFLTQIFVHLAHDNVIKYFAINFQNTCLQNKTPSINFAAIFGSCFTQTSASMDREVIAPSVPPLPRSPARYDSIDAVRRCLGSYPTWAADKPRSPARYNSLDAARRCLGSYPSWAAAALSNVAFDAVVSMDALPSVSVPVLPRISVPVLTDITAPMDREEVIAPSSVPHQPRSPPRYNSIASVRRCLAPYPSLHTAPEVTEPADMTPLEADATQPVSTLAVCADTPTAVSSGASEKKNLQEEKPPRAPYVLSRGFLGPSCPLSGGQKAPTQRNLNAPPGLAAEKRSPYEVAAAFDEYDEAIHLIFCATDDADSTPPAKSPLGSGSTSGNATPLSNAGDVVSITLAAAGVEASKKKVRRGKGFGRRNGLN